MYIYKLDIITKFQDIVYDIHISSAGTKIQDLVHGLEETTSMCQDPSSPAGAGKMEKLKGRLPQQPEEAQEESRGRGQQEQEEREESSSLSPATLDESVLRTQEERLEALGGSVERVHHQQHHLHHHQHHLHAPRHHPMNNNSNDSQTLHPHSPPLQPHHHHQSELISDSWQYHHFKDHPDRLSGLPYQHLLHQVDTT